ncbi:transglutaminase-like cysteine peptidase [Alishewanella sp. d11]|uniref:transglutaminase-like cysteine peptidase n=1 Tax=Alishewanella sp. d11 TaxID=3414030 RepID=UPI003BF7CCDC
MPVWIKRRCLNMPSFVAASRKRTALVLGCTFLVCLLSLKGLTNATLFELSAQVMADTEAQFGGTAVARLNRWQRLINRNQDASDWQKLHLVNQFANREVAFASDQEHWGAVDYWATPLESLQTSKGDCEDYAILKYFTLRAMGVPEEKLRLMYVRALELNEPHMVLIYTEKPGQYPLVLDNLINEILPANKRPDLKPVYSFNAQGLWLARAQGLGKKVENSAGVAQFEQLLARIEPLTPLAN